MAATKVWTLEEVHSLPDDGNKYELVRGDLFVTPAPTSEHEVIAARLSALLTPYVLEQQLGHVYHPRAVFRFEGSEAEPDLMVRQPPTRRDNAWEDWPLPILVIEIGSPSTRRRDRGPKREFYRDGGIPEYWIVDPELHAFTVIRPDRDDAVSAETVEWLPEGASAPLVIDIPEVFGA